MGGQLSAEEKVVTGKFVVSFSAEDNQRSWIVSALEQNIYNDLSGYARVVPFKKREDEDQICVDRDTDCILELYRELDVDALMLGTVDDSDIDYEIYDIQKKALVNTGSIEIGTGSSLLTLRMGAFKAFKLFIENGGILEKRKYEAIADGQGKETKDQTNQEYLDRKLKSQVLIFLAVFTCFPYLLSFIGKPLRHPERSKIVLRWFYPFQIVSLLVIGYQFTLVTTVDIFPTILSLFDNHRWILTGFGGIAWGYFLIINFRIVIPHLQGIERIRPNNLFPLLESCLLTLLIKVLILCTFYLGFLYGILYIGKLFSMKQEVLFTFLFPLFGLYICYWVALMLDVFAMSLDVKLTNRKLDFDSVWNSKIRKYFISYLKRNGVTLNKRLVKDIVFLPGENEEVVCYGGGFSRPRIAIGRDLIKFALGDTDEDLEDTHEYDQKVVETVLRQSSAFQITADLSSERAATNMSKSRHERKKAKYLERVQKFFQRDVKLPGTRHSGILENVVQGIISPRLEGKDDLPSLMSNNSDDLKIVEKLLLEYSRSSDPYDDEAEVDDSSEEDKDFLFGILLHKFGGLLRHEDIFSTVFLYLRYKKAIKKRSYNFVFSRYFAVVADTFVVLNFGLNHLMQHLYYQATSGVSHLTTKGITSEYMLRSQDQILTGTKEVTDERRPRIFQTDEFDRIIWLSRFCQDAIRKQTNVRAKRFNRLAFSLGVTYLAIVVVMDSYNYHPKYVEIIEREKQEIAEAIKKAQEKEEKQGSVK